MKAAHDSFLDALPSGWKFDRFKDVVSLRNGKTDEASAEEDDLELEDLDSGTRPLLHVFPCEICKSHCLILFLRRWACRRLSSSRRLLRGRS